jgi:hypothetical protein
MTKTAAALKGSTGAARAALASAKSQIGARKKKKGRRRCRRVDVAALVFGTTISIGHSRHPGKSGVICARSFAGASVRWQNAVV